ncbi:MAG: ATP synthase F1 subunit delta [Vicinamibacterales bacterium]
MGKRASAGRYAKALFDVALQEDLLDQVAADLEGLSTLVSGHEELLRTFANPAIPAQAKRKLIEVLITRLALQGPLGKLLMLLAGRDRLWLVQDLRQSFTDRLNEHRRILQAEVVTAEPLAADQAAAWQTRLSTATGWTVSLTTRVDPALLGGVRARIGSTVYDGSVATQLARLRGSLVERL